MKKNFSKIFRFIFIACYLFLQPIYAKVTFQNKTNMKASLEFDNTKLALAPQETIQISLLNNLEKFTINFEKDKVQLADFQFSIKELDDDTLYYIMLGIYKEVSEDSSKEKLASLACSLLKTEPFKKIDGTLLKSYNPENLLSKEKK